ncbi:hypothetical protein RCL1_002624 [Eukaryota sp. TZLM3-RCL]
MSTTSSLPPHILESLSLFPNLVENLDRIGDLLYQICCNREPVSALSHHLHPTIYQELVSLLGSLLTERPTDPLANEFMPLFSLPSINDFPRFQPTTGLFSDSNVLQQRRGAAQPLRRSLEGRRFKSILTVTEENGVIHTQHQSQLGTLQTHHNSEEQTLSLTYDRVSQCTRGHWRSAEDQLLIQRVKSIGTLDWKKVALSIPNRTEAQCRYRFERVLRRRLAGQQHLYRRSIH